MTKTLISILMALTIPAGIVAEEARAEGANLRDAVVLVIRHAEDAAHGDGISPTGMARAKAYVDYFKSLNVNGRPVELNYLFAAKDTSRSHRPRLTLEPTAQAFGLKIDSQFKTKQLSGLVREIESLPAGKTIVICWRHSGIPPLLQKLSADPKTLLPEGKWPGKIFGWVVFLRYDDAGNLSESRVIKENFVLDDSRKHALTPLPASPPRPLLARDD